MRRFVLLLALLTLPTAFASSASWSGDDVAGDASPSLANAWADLRSASVSSGVAMLTLASAPASVSSTAYVLLHEEPDGWRFCAMIADRSNLFYTGPWDEERLAPADARRADGTFTTGSPATVTIQDCMPSNDTARVRALVISAAPTPVGGRALLLDAMDLVPAEGSVVAVASASQPSLPREGRERAVPFPALAIGVALVGAAFVRARKVA